MASTKPTYAVDIITNIGTTPEERAITTAAFKAKFDETDAAQKAWETNHCDENDAEFATKENKEITYVAVTASRNLTTDDLYKWIIATHASTPIVLTMPKNLTTEDAWIAIEQGGAAQVSVAAATDVTIKPATKLKVNGQDTAAVLTHRSATPNTWGWQGSIKA